ncbi:hypothetical protein K7H20_22000 [Salipiger manganoxidans]|nr:hypothetical protein [Salipiger manganoxidans]
MILGFFIATAVTSPAFADAVTSANKLCALFDSTGLTSAKCEISGWNSSVTTTIDMSSGEARDLCNDVSALMEQRGDRFGGWTLNIKSPYSGENPIAFCPLR